MVGVSVRLSCLQGVPEVSPSLSRTRRVPLVSSLGQRGGRRRQLPSEGVPRLQTAVLTPTRGLSSAASARRRSKSACIRCLREPRSRSRPMPRFPDSLAFLARYARRDFGRILLLPPAAAPGRPILVSFLLPRNLGALALFGDESRP